MVRESKRQLKVFLCHASGDKPPVRDLYKRLTVEGVDPWLDKEKLLPGQDWRREIPKAVQEADVVVVCLSNKSITKEGYVQKEIKFALDSAEEKPEGAIFLIPARLEDCPVPERLSRWQWVDLYEEGGFVQLLRSLKLRADAVGAAVEPSSYMDSDKETERRLEQLYTEGLAAFYTEDWDRACHRFQSILSERPNNKAASEKLAEAERQRDLAKLYAQAIEAYQVENWQSAISTLDELTKKSADYKDAASLLKNARKQNHIQELYAEAGRLHTARQWQAVVKVFEQITAIEPNFRDVNSYLPSAQKEVAEIKRLDELNSQYAHALRAMDAGNWEESRRLLETVHKSQTGFLETERLLRKVENEITREEEKHKQNDQISTLYEQAHGLLRSKKWRNALEKMDEISRLNEHFPDTDGIVENAQREIVCEEQEAERQNKLAALYAEAVKLLKAEKYQEALDTWQDVKATDPKYPDRQWVQRTAKKRLVGTRSSKGSQNDLKTRLGKILLNKDTTPSIEAESSIAAQTRAGWLILFVAVSWGIGRSAIESAARITGFFGLGANFLSIEIIVIIFGLFYGVTIWFMLRSLKIVLDNKKAILLVMGWLMGISIVPVLSWNFSEFTDLAWILAGSIAGLCTALVLWFPRVILRIRQIFIIVLGTALSIYVGEKISGVLVTDILPPSASFGFGSFIAGLLTAWILYNQLIQRDLSVDFAKQNWSILFVTAGWFFVKMIGNYFAYRLFPDVGFFYMQDPGFFIKTMFDFLISGLLMGFVFWIGVRIVVSHLSWKSCLLFMLSWATGILLVGIPDLIIKSGYTWLWSLSWGAGGSLAAFFSLVVLKREKIVVGERHMIAVIVAFGLSFVIGKFLFGGVLNSSMSRFELVAAIGIAVAVQSALAGFLGMTVFLMVNPEVKRDAKLNWKYGIYGAIGFTAIELFYIPITGNGSVDQMSNVLIAYALGGLVWGIFMGVPAKKWRTILLFGFLGAIGFAGATAVRQGLSDVIPGIIGLYLVYGVFFSVMLSVGHRSLSSVLALCMASVLVLFAQHTILLAQVKNPVFYWFLYFAKDLIIGSVIGLAWAYFLHPNPVSENGQIVHAVHY